jgi:signal transduction histidine kinase/DNA-binding NarL/FixJ family response regulator
MDVNFIVNLITISILFSFSIYYFLLYLGRKSSEKYNLYFSVFLFSLILYIIIHSLGKSIYSMPMKNYYDFNPVISHISVILLIYSFNKLLSEIIKPAKYFSKALLVFMIILLIEEVMTFQSLIAGYDWFKKYLAIYIIVITSIIAIMTILVFIYNVIINRRYKDSDILILTIACIFLGVYFIVFSIINNFIHISNFGFIAVYAMMVAYSLSLKSNKEFIELENIKNELEMKIMERTRESMIISEQKTNLFLNLAHETKTPLTLIGNYLDNYISKNRINKDLTIIKNNIDKMSNDIVNYFDMEKLISGNDFYDNDRITCISEVLEEKIRLYEEMVSDKPIDIIKNIEKNIFIKIDPYAFDRIINNLLDNALKFTNQANGKIITDMHTEDGKVVLSIKDNGIGISEDKIEKIFEPYYQIQNQKRNIYGMGLGLSIIKKILDSINAKITVNSYPGKGACFSICFDNYNPSDEDRIDRIVVTKPFPVNATELFNDSFKKGRKNIIVVEDNIELINYLHENISQKYNCFLALNGKMAIEKLRSIPKPDLIISDIMMDEMDGFSFFDEVHNEEGYNDIPFIFLTAKSEKDDIIEGLKKGAVDYLTKPFSIDELLFKIDSIIVHNSYKNETIRNNIINRIYDDFSSEKDSDENQELDFNMLCENLRLTEKEKVIIRLLLKGLEYKEICHKLEIPYNTIKKSIQTIYKKCGVKNKMELNNIFK